MQQFDFDELEKATEYEGGFTDKSQTIVDFWAIVHALPMEYKKKLLEFTTGNYALLTVNNYTRMSSIHRSIQVPIVFRSVVSAV